MLIFDAWRVDLDKSPLESKFGPSVNGVAKFRGHRSLSAAHFGFIYFSRMCLIRMPTINSSRLHTLSNIGPFSFY